jgi:hypothetical protein
MKSHHIIPHHIIPHHITSHLTTAHHIIPHHITSHLTTAHHIITLHYHTTPHHVTSHQITPSHHITPHSTFHITSPHYTTSHHRIQQHHIIAYNITPHYTRPMSITQWEDNLPQWKNERAFVLLTRFYKRIEDVLMQKKKMAGFFLMVFMLFIILSHYIKDGITAVTSIVLIRFDDNIDQRWSSNTLVESSTELSAHLLLILEKNSTFMFVVDFLKSNFSPKFFFLEN